MNGFNGVPGRSHDLHDQYAMEINDNSYEKFKFKTNGSCAINFVQREAMAPA